VLINITVKCNPVSK